MAIDFGRMARGVATGYLSAKIANTEANDQLKTDIVKQAGLNFYQNTLPEFQKKETNRKETYTKIKSRFSPEIAEYMDQQGFITGSSSDFEDIVKMLSDNNNFNEAKLKSYLESTKAGTYTERAEKRFQSMDDRQKFIMGNMTKNGFGVNTLRNQLGMGAPEEKPAVPTGMAEGIAPVPPTPEVTKDIQVEKLPSFEEIFGVESGVDKQFMSMDREDKAAIENRALSEFKAIYSDTLTGDISVPENYKKDYQKLSDEQKGSLPIEQYTYNRWFEEQYLPSKGYTYQKTLPSDIVEAKSLINQYRAIGDDETVKEIKQRLINAGYDIRDYNL